MDPGAVVDGKYAIIRSLGQGGMGAVFALTLSLIARGSFDVPLHALAATAASLWVILAVADPRAFWQTLLASKAAVPAGPSTTAPVRPEG